MTLAETRRELVLTIGGAALIGCSGPSAKAPAKPVYVNIQPDGKATIGEKIGARGGRPAALIGVTPDGHIQLNGADATSAQLEETMALASRDDWSLVYFGDQTGKAPTAAAKAAMETVNQAAARHGLEGGFKPTTEARGNQ